MGAASPEPNDNHVQTEDNNNENDYKEDENNTFNNPKTNIGKSESFNNVSKANKTKPKNIRSNSTQALTTIVPPVTKNTSDKNSNISKTNKKDSGYGSGDVLKSSGPVLSKREVTRSPEEEDEVNEISNELDDLERKRDQNGYSNVKPLKDSPYDRAHFRWK